MNRLLEAVEDAHLVAERDQPVDRVGADEASASRDEHAHRLLLRDRALYSAAPLPSSIAHRVFSPWNEPLGPVATPRSPLCAVRAAVERPATAERFGRF